MGDEIATLDQPASYYEWVGRFALVRIGSEAQCDRAQAVIDQLLRQTLDGGGEAYLEALSTLLEAYESDVIDVADASARDVLADLVENSTLGRAELASEVNIDPSTLSALLDGAAKMTAEQMIKFAAHFGLPPSAFLPD